MEKFEKITALLSGEVFLLCLVLGSFLLGVYLYKRLKFPLLQPLLISVVIIIPFLKIADIEYNTFYQQTKILNFMLGPSVVALGYILYEQIEYIKGNVMSMLIAVFAGSLVGIVTVIGTAKLMGADKILQMSLAPKSVTTPIAISIAQNTGGVPELAVAFVVICGIFGGLVGPLILRYLGIQSKIAKGLAIGSASHALGTTRALEMGALEGAISGLAIGIMGVMTAILIPFVERFIL
ncbi:LrgB family protein [Parabacteroides sp. 52]|uniref:LrgB family protein n=1 Tax=Parabacteroides sp. PM5-20 TaxID=2940527 RepID=UPI0013D5BFD4|nr:MULTISPECIES: LrgB family protein [unclassified Parabacteroides]MDH6535256.1 putative murein hydrolase (TIGR00659 family) [Parabacteroides sp. PM5-20]NDV55819.1 LrgB family protein [Parabacteroides sp. 52]